MSIQDNIRAGLLSGGGYTKGPVKNTPSRYADRRTAYFAEETDLFISEYAQYASDYQNAELQFFDENGGMVWEDVTVRFANIVNPSAAIQRHFDDYKNVLFDQRRIDYIQPGSKLVTMGSTWIAFNPDNISSTVANGIFRRCNAVWNHLDWFGNVVSEPIIVEPERANASSPDTQESQRISSGYYNVICQYNDFTRQINDNTRLVLGGKTYEVTGYGDFSQEFTGDYSTVRILSFTVRVETKNQETDDMVNHVAGGLAFSFASEISGPDSVTVGKTAQYRAFAYRNGEDVTNDPDNTPVFTYEVTDLLFPKATIDKNTGVLTATGTGTVNIKATLTQNPSVTATKKITVLATGSGSKGLRFTVSPPTAADPFTNFSVTVAAYLESGEEHTSINPVWTLTGADQKAYSYTANNRTLSVNVFGYSETPLTITASVVGFGSVSADVVLNGW